MLNHPFVLTQAELAAKRLLGEKHADDDARITRAYRLTLGREPTNGEREISRKFLKSQLAKNEKNEKEAWAALIHALFASAEFRYVN